MTRDEISTRIETLETELTDLERSVQDHIESASEAMESYRTRAADVVSEIASLKAMLHEEQSV